jgi:hypothetical protein
LEPITDKDDLWKAFWRPHLLPAAVMSCHQVSVCLSRFFLNPLVKCPAKVSIPSIPRLLRSELSVCGFQQPWSSPSWDDWSSVFCLALKGQGHWNTLFWHSFSPQDDIRWQPTSTETPPSITVTVILLFSLPVPLIKIIHAFFFYGYLRLCVWSTFLIWRSIYERCFLNLWLQPCINKLKVWAGLSDTTTPDWLLTGMEVCFLR